MVMQVTGLAGENVIFHDGVDFVYKDDDSRFALRPETVESLFILHESKFIFFISIQT